MKDKNDIKKPVSEEVIFRSMMIVVGAVASLFFIKNLLGQAYQGAAVIGGCLLFFAVLILGMKKAGIAQAKQQLVICISIVLLVFFISLNSGDFYSDDFPLYLSVVGICGLYLKPKFTLIQGALIDVLLVAAYLIHPEKADPLSQYLMCLGIFTIGTICFYMVIKRGRAYIEIAQIRAAEAERLIEELQSAGKQLQKSCRDSMEKIGFLEEANNLLDASAGNLKQGSDIISRDTKEVSDSFEGVHMTMQTTHDQIDELNKEVKKVEDALSGSRGNLKDMMKEVGSLEETVDNTYKVFRALQEEIKQISAITGELNKIASDTTMLALNASIEAARAGNAGSGFNVVASKVHDLAMDSNQCAAKVAAIVNSMEKRIEKSEEQLLESNQAIGRSVESLGELEGSFEKLIRRFGRLYGNIGEQNENIYEMDKTFGDLKEKIEDMARSSDTNQLSVDEIARSIEVYRQNMTMVVHSNKEISQLSDSLLEMSS